MLKLRYDALLSNSAFKFNLRRYTKEDHATELRALRCRVAATEGDLVASRDDLRRTAAEGNERRRDLEARAAAASLSARRAKEDQHGRACRRSLATASNAIGVLVSGFK